MFGHLPIPRPIAVALEALPHKTFPEYGLPDEISHAGIVLEPTGRHTLALGSSFWKLNEEQQTFVLIHEFTHLAYGHPLQCMKLKLNPVGWNIATDAWINEVHPHRLTQELNGILYSELRSGMPAKPPSPACPNGIPAREPIPELPPYLIDPIAIYNILKEKTLEGSNGMDMMIVSDLTEEGLGKASLEVLKARLAVAQAAQEDATYKRLAEELAAGYGHATGLYSEVRISDWLEGIYQQLDRLASMRQGDLERRRGWRRPGRYPGVPGVSRRPSLHVMIALDVSGSTTSWWGDIIAATRGITRNHTVEIVCHNEEIVFHGPSIPADAPVGGGTAFKPVMQLAQQRRPDCLVWVTDGESSDKPKLPDCPIHWVWLPSSRQWPLREGDSQSQYKEMT